MKIGFLTDNKQLSGQACEIYSYLQARSDIELNVVLNLFPGNRRLGLKRKLNEYGVKRFAARSVFAIIGKIESRGNLCKTCHIQADIEITPLPSNGNIHYRYVKSDIAQLRKGKFDLLVRGGGRGIYKGDILTVARNGILSLHHSDNRKITGGPPGFWEIVEGHTHSGFIIQILTEKLDGGTVVGRGEIPTKTSFSQNKAAILAAASSYFKTTFDDYMAKGEFLTFQTHHLGRFYSIPGFRSILEYLHIRITSSFGG